MNPVPRHVGTVRFAPAKTFWLWLNVTAGIWVLCHGFSFTEGMAVFALSFLTLCLGHSVGLHRGIIHGTFAMPTWFKRFLVSLFVLTGLGGPLSWIRLHRVRDFWQNRIDCPPYFSYGHNLILDFYWNLHCRFDPTSWTPYALASEIETDGFLHLLQRTWWMWNILFFGLVSFTLGWESAMVLGPARVAGSISGHWFIGFWTHKYGHARFEIEGASEIGTNSLLLGWISFGEGFHNNHHAFPDSARIGHTSFEFDLGWLSILVLERLGLAMKVKSWSRPSAQRRSHSTVDALFCRTRNSARCRIERRKRGLLRMSAVDLPCR